MSTPALNEFFTHNQRLCDHAWLIITSSHHGSYDETCPEVFAKHFVEQGQHDMHGRVAGQPNKRLDEKMAIDFANGIPCYIGFPYTNNLWYIAKLTRFEKETNDDGSPARYKQNGTANMYKFTAQRLGAATNTYISRSEMIKTFDDDNDSTMGVMRLLRKNSNEYNARWRKHTDKMIAKLRARFPSEEAYRAYHHLYEGNV